MNYYILSNRLHIGKKYNNAFVFIAHLSLGINSFSAWQDYLKDKQIVSEKGSIVDNNVFFYDVIGKNKKIKFLSKHPIAKQLGFVDKNGWYFWNGDF